MYYVYILESLKDHERYIGYTHDLTKRLDEHNQGKVVSTQLRKPFKLIYYEACLHQKDALTRERYLKRRWGSKFIETRLRYYYGKS